MLKSKIDKPYEKHDCSRICQGDIFRDFTFRNVDNATNAVNEYKFPYIVVISQDCDLENSKYQGDIVSNNQFLPNILFLPAFPSEIVRTGEHFTNIYNITQKKIDSDLWKPIIQNRNERFHFLKKYQDLQIPDLLIDFKTYYTLPTKYFTQIHKECYLATINELFREDLSTRFSFYISRIALPKL